MSKYIFLLNIIFFLNIGHFALAQNVSVSKPEENIRPIPNGRNISGTVRKGVRLRKLEVKDNWTKIRFEGWIYSPSLKVMDEEETPITDENVFQVIHWNWKQVGGMVRLQGVVENKSSYSFKSVKVVLTLFDQDDNELGGNFTYLQSENIDAHQINGFKTYIRNVKINEGSPKLKFDFEYR